MILDWIGLSFLLSILTMPLHSMTAYGFGEVTELGQTLSCEIRTLNARFLEVNVRLPRHLIALEVDIINHVKASLRRGKVDVFFDVQKVGAGRELPRIDAEALQHYAQIASQAAQTLQRETGALQGSASIQLNPLALLELEGVLSADTRGRARGTEAVEAARKSLFSALDQALDATRKARQKEGESLAVALFELTKSVESERQAVLSKRSGVLAMMQKSLSKRLDAIVQNFQNSSGSTVAFSAERLALEVAALADKADIEEELTRLATHLSEFDRLLSSEEVGRKLDFLCQEMHREVNTMSNKLLQTEIAQHTIEMKQLVERIRQQVQNIE